VLSLAQGAEAEALHERCDALCTAFGPIELAGLMQRVTEMTAEYISNRVQFGQPIAKFQAARHHAADMLMQTQTARWTAYHASTASRATVGYREIWLAKHWAIRASQTVFELAHLLHGGVGVGTEYPLHLLTQAMAAFAVRSGDMNEVVTASTMAWASPRARRLMTIRRKAAIAGIGQTEFSKDSGRSTLRMALR
jgi:alkylation response protein AidB-like acyl-CoA dehydrogenase